MNKTMRDEIKTYSVSETTIRDILRVMFNHKVVIISVLIVVVASTYIGLSLRIPMYNSVVKILVTGQMQKDVQYERQLGPGSLVETQSKLVFSLPVIERVVRALKLDQLPLNYEKQFASGIRQILIDRDAANLKKDLEELPVSQRKAFLFQRAVQSLYYRVTTVPVGQQSSIFEIWVKGYTPSEAARLANVVSRSYVIFDIEQQIAELKLSYGEKNPTIVKLENHIEKLRNSLDGRPLPDIEALGPASVKIIAQATMGQEVPLKPGMVPGMIIALLIGLVSGVTLAYVFDYFDQTIKTTQDVETYLNMRQLESLPERNKSGKFTLIDFNKPYDKYSQSIVNLAEKIYLIMKSENLKSILLSDFDGLEDTPYIASNIGIYLAQKTEKRVLIIDANLRGTYSVSSVFNVPNTNGLTDIVHEKMSLEEAVYLINDDLYILTSSENSANPVSVLESSSMSDIIKRAEEEFEIVLIHCVQLKDFTDSIVLSPYVDCMALIINEGKVKKQVVKNYLEPLKNKGVNIIGVVLNNRTYAIPEIIYRLT